MGILGTAFLYGLIGVAVAVAMALQAMPTERGRRWVLFVGTLLFWPLFAPLVLARSEPTAGTGTRRGAPGANRAAGAALATSGVEGRIQRAEAEVLAAIARLDGLAEAALAPEVERVEGLAGALVAMARRVAEIEALLSTPEFSADAARAKLLELEQRGTPPGDSRSESARARLRNIERLAGIEVRTRDDLERALLELEEMSSQMVLLKYAGSDGEVVERIRQIARTVESITEGLLAAT
jgi:hypothetical protein